MSVIRRWTIYVCPLCGSDEYDSTENDSLCRKCGEWMNVEPVEVEPSITTQGAVSALRRIARPEGGIRMSAEMAQIVAAEALPSSAPWPSWADRMTERDEPDPMNPERLPTGTLLDDLGCPHCGKTCDVCVILDEQRHQLQGALREIHHAFVLMEAATISESDAWERIERALVSPGGQ